jgi:hypothetical protein
MYRLISPSFCALTHHRCHRVGQPPYDHVTTFARANVDSTVLACDVFGGDVHCAQKKGTVIKAPIYAAIA